MVWRTAVLAGGALIAAGCVYPYETAFRACDEAAGACYQQCETVAAGPLDGDPQRQCRMVCEERASVCFADAYPAARPTGSAYAYSGAWRGHYGYWRPQFGYAYGLHYRGGYRNPYYYDRYYYGRSRRHYDRRGRGGGGIGAAPPIAPPAAPPPQASPPPARPTARPPRRTTPLNGSSPDGRRIDKN